MSQRLRWTQHGQIFLWRYCEGARNYPGWHMTADASACESLLALIDVFQLARWPCKQVIRVSKPNANVLAVPSNNGGEAKWVTRQSLRLDYPKDRVAPEFWMLSADEHAITLQLGARKLVELRDGVSAIMEGRGDYAIGPDDKSRFDTGCLWFWWFPTST